MMASVRFCPKCGSSTEGGRFCKMCGTDLSVISEAISDPGATRRLRRRGEKGKVTLALFGSSAVSNEESDLNGHSAASLFGELSVDLSAGPVPETEIRLRGYSLFSNIDVIIPDDVAVRVTGLVILGRVEVRGERIGDAFFEMREYRSPGYDQSTRRVHIDAAAVLGNVTVSRPHAPGD